MSGFSQLELTVIRLAAAPREARSAGARRLPRITRFVGRRHGNPQPLANPRLEALRAMAALLHRRFSVSPEEIDAFLAAGWCEGDLRRVEVAVDSLPAIHRVEDNYVSSRER